MTAEEYNNSVDKYADGLYRFVLKMLKRADISEDIVQDTFEKLWMNVSKVENIKVKSYLYKIAYNATIDQTRRDKHFSEEVAAETIHHEQYSDLNELLHAAAEQLPTLQRSVLFLRDYEGYSYQEIESITSLSEAQVKVYIYRARLHMRKIIGKIEVVI